MAIGYHAAADPDRVALVADGRTLTYAELHARANQLAGAWRAAGLVAGDGVAVLSANRAEFVEVYLATQRSGLRLTPVNWHLTPDEVAYIVGDCEAKGLVVDARFGEIAAPAAAASPATSRLVIGGDLPGFERYEDALGREDPSDLEAPSLGGTMIYTSGTTGRPKGVRRPEMPPVVKYALRLQRYRLDDGPRADGGDVHLCTGPMYHAGPLMFSCSVPLLAGATVVLMERFDAATALELIETHRVTHTHMVPTMFHRLLSVPDDVRSAADVSSLRYVVHGAAPCPVAVKQRLIEWVGPIVFEYYAATEGLGTFVDSETWLAKPGTVGKPVPADQVFIGDEEGTPLATGEIGHVWLKAATIGRFEYFKDGDKTASTYRGEHFSLGDMGYLDEDGFLFLTDRTANVIISGGVNIYPAEVDAVLLEHPAVGDAATIGVPDEEWGESVLAVVEPGRDVTPSSELATELVEFCRDRLAHYKCPKRVEFVDELPRQDNGKIYKRVLRERYRASSAPTSSGA